MSRTDHVLSKAGIISCSELEIDGNVKLAFDLKKIIKLTANKQLRDVEYKYLDSINLSKFDHKRAE